MEILQITVHTGRITIILKGVLWLILLMMLASRYPERQCYILLSIWHLKQGVLI